MAIITVGEALVKRVVYRPEIIGIPDIFPAPHPIDKWVHWVYDAGDGQGRRGGNKSPWQGGDLPGADIERSKLSMHAQDTTTQPQTEDPRLIALAELINTQTLEYLTARYPDSAAAGLLKRNAAVIITHGTKYIRVDVGRSGKYMIDKATDKIFGIKAYGVPHRGHYFGTLDTIHAYHWGGYRAARKEAN